ncbi:MAG: glycosyltransferase family 2 protein [Oscillospiraceae bacterium]|jgi:hypothetical protein|nr:glycosyltransferase family 2 protein [Oscillospiraceae bacterium]
MMTGHMIGDAAGLFFLIFTSLVGVFTLLRLLAGGLLGAPPEESVISILPMRGREERAEYLLRSLARQGSRILVADFGMDEETRAVVTRLQAEQTNLRLLDEEELEACLLALGRED